MVKVAFWITSGPDQEEKVLSGLNIAARMKANRGQTTEVYLYGPAVQLIGEGTEATREKIKALKEAGVPVGHCPANAKAYQVEKSIEDQGIYAQAAGEVMIRLVEEGFSVVGY